MEVTFYRGGGEVVGGIRGVVVFNGCVGVFCGFFFKLKKKVFG